eukprot:4669529-Amphidinium_carterae.1
MEQIGKAMIYRPPRMTSTVKSKTKGWGGHEGSAQDAWESQALCVADAARAMRRACSCSSSRHWATAHGRNLQVVGLEDEVGAEPDSQLDRDVTRLTAFPPR